MVRAALHKCFFGGWGLGEVSGVGIFFFWLLDLCKPCTNLHVTTVEKVFITNFWTSTKCAQSNIWERSGLWRRNFFSFQTYAIMHKARWANSWELLQNHGSIYYKGAGDLVCNTHNKFKTWTLNSWHLDTACIWAISFSLFLLLQSFEVL
jgi:hypothetical protein